MAPTIEFSTSERRAGARGGIVRLQDQFAAALTAYGYVEQESPSKKARLFFKSGSSVCFFWLGKSGSVRYSAVKRLDASVPASDQTKAKILTFLPKAAA